MEFPPNHEAGNRKGKRMPGVPGFFAVVLPAILGLLTVGPAQSVEVAASEEAATLGTDAPQILISARILTFDRQDIDAGLGLSQTLFMQNVGNADLNITNVQTLDPEFVITADSGETILGPDEFRQLGIAFDPAAEGRASSSLVIQSDSPGEENLEVVLSGRGVLGPELDFNPAQIVLSAVPLGTPANTSIEIWNNGSAQLQISLPTLESVSGQGQTGSDFSLGTVPGDDLQIAPGMATTQNIQFQPATTGFKTVLLTVPSNDPEANPARALLSGYTPNPVVIPGGMKVDFGRNAVESEAGVPVLSKIPTIGRLFTVTRQNTHTQYDATLLILIRPTIAFHVSEAEAFGTGPETKSAADGGRGVMRTLTAVAPGEQVNLFVEYAPQEFGEHIAFMEIGVVLTPAGGQAPEPTGIEPDEVHLIALRGELVAPGIPNEAGDEWAQYE